MLCSTASPRIGITNTVLGFNPHIIWKQLDYHASAIRASRTSLLQAKWLTCSFLVDKCSWPPDQPNHCQWMRAIRVCDLSSAILLFCLLFCFQTCFFAEFWVPESRLKLLASSWTLTVWPPVVWLHSWRTMVSVLWASQQVSLSQISWTKTKHNMNLLE